MRRAATVLLIVAVALLMDACGGAPKPTGDRAAPVQLSRAEERQIDLEARERVDRARQAKAHAEGRARVRHKAKARQARAERAKEEANIATTNTVTDTATVTAPASESPYASACEKSQPSYGVRYCECYSGKISAAAAEDSESVYEEAISRAIGECEGYIE